MIPNVPVYVGVIWPCVQCGGCQTPALPPTPPTEIAFGVDWPPDSDGTDDHANTVGPSASVVRDIDVSAVPNNSAIIIRMSLLWFQLSTVGAINLFYNMVILASRDDLGTLDCDVTCTATQVVFNKSGISVFNVDTIHTPDANTVRVTLKNLMAENAIVFWRWVISTVAAGNPLPPP